MSTSCPLKRGDLSSQQLMMFEFWCPKRSFMDVAEDLFLTEKHRVFVLKVNPSATVAVSVTFSWPKKKILLYSGAA